MVSKLGGSPSPGEVCPPAPRRAPLGLPWGFPRPLPTLRAAPGRARLDPHFVAAGLGVASNTTELFWGVVVVVMGSRVGTGLA